MLNLIFLGGGIAFQSAELYKNEEVEYQLAAKQECFVWAN